MDARIVTAVNNVIRLGWAHPNSEVAKVIWPDLAKGADVVEWDPQVFIQKGMPRLRTWVRGNLPRLDKHLLDVVIQKFVERMMSRRPDIHFDERKGTRRAHLVGILQMVAREAAREERSGLKTDWLVDRPDPRQADPLSLLERQEEAELVTRLVRERSQKQREALAERYSSDPPLVSTNIPARVIHTRRGHAMRSLRDQAERLGLRQHESRPGRARRRRFRPSRHQRRSAGRQPLKLLREGSRCERVDSNDPKAALMTSNAHDLKSRNDRALQVLFGSLPNDLRARVDVLTMVRDTFEREFALRAVRNADERSNDSVKSPPA